MFKIMFRIYIFVKYIERDLSPKKEINSISTHHCAEMQ